MQTHFAYIIDNFISIVNSVIHSMSAICYLSALKKATLTATPSSAALTQLFTDILKHYKRNIWMKNAKGTA